VRVAVSGGAGFIGSHLVDALTARGDEVLIIDDLSSGVRTNLPSACRFHQEDIRSGLTLALLREWRPDAICHLAAQMSVSRSVREPLFDASVNIIGSLNMLEAAREMGSRFIFSSTGGALYGNANILPTAEDHPTWPLSPYGVSKLSFEHYLHCYQSEHDLSYAALRYANVYGPRQNPHGEAGVVAIFCRAMLAGQAPVIHGSGTHTRDYVYVSDVVNANLAALDSMEIGHFNVGSGRQTTVNELFSLLSHRLGVTVAATHGPERRGEQVTSALDSSLIGRKLGWKANVDLEQGLSLTVDWFRSRAGGEGQPPLPQTSA